MLPPRYDDEKAIGSAESRHRERHLSHARALRDRDRLDGIVSRIVGRLASLRTVFTKRGALAYDFTKRGALAYDEHELTDYVCRLKDGSLGRVAIRESDGEWFGVCVKVG